MATMTKENEKEFNNVYMLVHPLDDLPEEKCNPDGLPPMHMTLSRKLSLMALRAYLIVMLVLVVYGFVQSVGMVGH